MDATACRRKSDKHKACFSSFLLLNFNPLTFFRIVNAPRFIFIAFKDEEIIEEHI